MPAGIYSGSKKAKYQNEKNKDKQGMLTGGQAKIAAKAPPPNKIDEKDFAVLRAEKAKGRGMGLQDEKVQPGKVMKAKMGVATDYKKYLKGLKKATDSVKKDKDNKFIKRRMKLMGMPKLSKGGGSDTSKTKNKKMPKAIAQGKRKEVIVIDMMPADTAMRTGSPMPRRMGGGMMKKYSSGGESSYTKGYEGRKTGKGVRESLKDKVTPMKKERLLEGLKASGKMGGGMIAPSQRPGYSKGVMVKARGCKLGRTRPTKIT